MKGSKVYLQISFHWTLISLRSYIVPGLGDFGDRYYTL